MTKFLVLYRSPVSARDQMANATPEQAQAGMEAWQAWAQRAGPSIADFGAPLAGDGDITGFSIRSSLDRHSTSSSPTILTDTWPTRRSMSSSSYRSPECDAEEI